MFVFILLSILFVSNGAPIAKRMVDLTYVFDETTNSHTSQKKFKMETTMYGKQEGGYWAKTEDYSSSIHMGTHMDAPSHFAEHGIPVDQIPISNFMVPAAVIDITAKAELDPDAGATVEDLLHWETITGQSLNGTFVMLKSGWGRKWGDYHAFFGSIDGDTYNLRSPGLEAEAAQWLVDNRAVIGLGVDTVSLDRGSRLGFYETHQIILGHGLYGIEMIANMEELPIAGATLYIFPMKIGNASGAPTRIIATFSEDSNFLPSGKLEL